MKRLKDEISAANLSELPQWKETSRLPYLGAVIKEAMRIHSPIGLILERIVPAGGVTICGHFFAEGTIVGCNPAVIGHSSEVYGKQYSVDEFWPERWLEADEAQIVLMERCFLAFGSGKRTCIGKNISLLEIHKLVPLLLTKFTVRSSKATRPTLCNIGD
jgi:cytochrome P450